MKALDDLAFDLATFCDEADLRRVRSMSEADFVMLLALHGAAEVELCEVEQSVMKGDDA